jgi:glycosyltransferase involved in cell wall biosynthesis
MAEAVRVLSVDLERGWRGGENQVFLLQRGLRELAAPIRSTVLCRADEPLARRLVEAGLAAEPVCGTLTALARIRSLIRRGQVDVLHAHTGRSHGLCLLAAAGTRVPVVVTRRVDFAVGKGITGRWKYGPRVARFVAISEAIAGILAAGGVPADAITTIPSGVDPARTAAGDGDRARRALGLADDEPVVLCAAALVAHKGHRHLLDAWADVERTVPRAVLLLAGDGDLGPSLAAQARALGLGRVRFLGWREDVPDLLAASRAFVMTSVEEGLGTALIDAFFAGVPVVATAAGGIPDLVEDGITGDLLPVGDHAGVARALVRVLTDPGRTTATVAAARNRAEARFHYRAMAAGYASLYRELVPEPTARP